MMLEVEGYKMFTGALRVVPVNPDIKPFTESGTFLYKPDTQCWYGNGRSFPARICYPLVGDSIQICPNCGTRVGPITCERPLDTM